ncbi:flavin reductase [Sinomonas cellulolyticus]|uniref:Flavin reductase family protein n=1 Tax=Sinomonas cellulolyticus TaxID=2801916 RepID=A0ABS1K5S8_9MICC|nr:MULTISPECIES: flavin reductase family protein [Sinomonas]MBL0707025.1 flavin reductase family protein [Sinomonas cellulolyticus]GHG54259.1 flavin reductase [Sinomonas sp. KCTC 49339]
MTSSPAGPPRTPTALAESALFRAAFRDHPSGVSIVTAASPEGPVGLTASSVASVAADPPTLAFSVSGGRSAVHIAEALTVVVHLVDADQIGLVRMFATPGSERFTSAMDWETLLTGEPWLRAAPWALRCSIDHRMPVGPSVMLAGTVLEILTPDAAQSPRAPGAPLVYHDRAFHALGEHSRIL